MTDQVRVEGERQVKTSTSSVKVGPGRALNIQATGARVIPKSGQLTVRGSRRVSIDRSDARIVTVTLGRRTTPIDDAVTLARDAEDVIQTATYDDGEIRTYHYDGTSGLLDEVTTNRSTEPVATYTRDANGYVQRIEWGN